MIQFIIYGAILLVCFICNLVIEHRLSWFFIVVGGVLIAVSLTLLPVLVNKKRGVVTLGGFTLSVLFLLLVCSIYAGGSWFFVASSGAVLGMSVVFAPYVFHSLCLPVPICNHKALLSIAADTLLLFALLLLCCNLYVGGGWFFSKALPITSYVLLIPWGMLLILRYTHINGFLKTANCLALWLVNVYFLTGVIDLALGNISPRIGIHFDFAQWEAPFIDQNVKAILYFILLGLAILFTVTGAFYELHKIQSGNASR